MYTKYKYSYLNIKKIKSNKNLYYFLDRLNFKGMNMSIITDKYSSNDIEISNTVYLEYLMNCLKNDNFKYEDLNIFKLDQKEILGNVNLSIIENNVFLSNIYNYCINKQKKRMRKKKRLKIKFKWNNSIVNIHNDIKSRRISNRLLIPHYFFPIRYTEKSKLPQSMSWKNNIYSFLKLDKSGIKYMDMYTEKIIKLFFQVGSVNKGFRFTNIIKKGITFRYTFPLFEYINRIIKYTSIRSSSSISKLSHYPQNVLTFEWLIEQIKSSISLRKLIELKKGSKGAGFSTRKSDRVSNWDKVLISKPIFKHTSFNVIIDLFVFNNKSIIDKKMDNLLLRRIMYKYMYSMYYNWFDKIKETINRPRFFYLNLIQPHISYYYSEIIKLYGNVIIKSNRTWFYYLCLFFFKWNFLNNNSVSFLKSYYFLFNDWKKNFPSLFYPNNNYNKFLNKSDINNLKYKKWFYNKNFNLYKYFNSFIYFRNYVGFKKININILDVKKNVLNIRANHTNKELIKLRRKKEYKKKSKYLNQKKYLNEMEWRGNTPVDVSKLTLWNRRGLGPKIIKKKEEKIFRHNKFSLEEFKKKNYYAKGKSKRRVSPKIWKAKLMNFFLFSHTQKKDANPNKKFLNVFNKKLDMYNYSNKSSSYSVNKDVGKFIFDKHKESYYYNKGSLFFDNKIESNKKFNIINNQQSYNNEYNKQYIKSNNFYKQLLFNKNELKIKNNINNLMNQSNKFELEESKKTLMNVKFSSFNNSNYINPWDNLKNKKNLKNKRDKFNTVSLNKFYLNSINWNIFYKQINKKYLILFALYDKKVNKFSKDNREVFVKMDSRKLNKNIYEKNFFNNMKTNIKYKNNTSKELWDNFDNYFIWIFSELYSKKNIVNIFNWLVKLPYHNLIKKVKNKVNNIDAFYLEAIKNEFNDVKRDIVIQKKKYVWSNQGYHNNLINNHYYDNNQRGINITFHSGKENFNSQIWTNNVNNERDENLNFKLGYNQKIIKPYYRYMVPLFIMQSYFKFINNLGYTKLLLYFKRISNSNLNWIKNNNITILNYIIIKTLFDILRFNYRSLIRLKPKYYFINKLRYYQMKLNLLSFNNWTHSLKYINNLRNTPNNFWMRYHKVASYYYGRIFQYAELGTRRKVLLPFVFYFEDILYNIYGKWALIRLWPIKKYFLNSYILADRLMRLLLARTNTMGTISEFRQMNRYFMYVIRTKQIDKTYYSYNYNNSRWPNKLINFMKDNNNNYNYNNIKPFGVLNYQNLEYINIKTKKEYILNSYFLNKNLLFHSLPFSYYYKKICLKLYRKILESNNRRMIGLSRLNGKDYFSFWIRPIKNYIRDMNRGIDIKGIRFRIAGRPGKVKCISRGLYKNYYYGNFLGTRHFWNKKGLHVSLYHAVLRGTIKSNIDYSNSIGVTANGSISLKIWMSSGLINDIQVLLLHLLHIKILYNQLLHKHVLINSSIKKIRDKNFVVNNLYKYKWLKRYYHNKRRRKKWKGRSLYYRLRKFYKWRKQRNQQKWQKQQKQYKQKKT